MGLLHKNYKSLKQVIDQFQVLKEEYFWQLETYELFDKRLQSVDSHKEEKLSEYEAYLRKNLRIEKILLLFLLIFDSIVISKTGMIISFLTSLGSPLFMFLILALPVYFIGVWNRNIFKSLLTDSYSLDTVKDSKFLLEKAKSDKSLFDLLKELRFAIRNSERAMIDLLSGIEEYTLLLTEYENNMNACCALTSKKEDFKILDAGIKKLNLLYKEDGKNE